MTPEDVGINMVELLKLPRFPVELPRHTLDNIAKAFGLPYPDVMSGQVNDDGSLSVTVASKVDTVDFSFTVSGEP